MLWVPIIAWCVAVALALVVFGYGGYELAWKTKRLRGDLRDLQRLDDQLTALRAGLAAAQKRAAATAAGLR